MDAQDLHQALESELLPGEALLWTGQPSRKVVFHKHDAALIPLSLVWGGPVTLFATADVIRVGLSGIPWNSRTLLTLTFLTIGQYLIWGRFLQASWRKGRVIYGLTPKRLLILDRTWGRSVSVAYINQIPLLERTARSDGIGTVRFGYPFWTGPARNHSSFDVLDTEAVPHFVDIENAESVYALIAKLHRESKSRK